MWKRICSFDFCVLAHCSTHTKSIPIWSHSKMLGKWFETENEQQKEAERPQERKKQQRQKATRQSPNPM